MITRESSIGPKQILFHVDPQVSVGAVMSATGAVAVGVKKVQKAGTPVTGDLTARTTAFTKAGDTDAVGVLLHDVDVTAGNSNATVLLFGFVDLNKLDSDAVALITAGVKTALAGKVWFLK